MKFIVVGSHTLFDEGNRRSCLSAHRSSGQCYKCHLYVNCESRIINHKYDTLVKKRANLYKKLEKISQDIEGL